MGVFGIALFMRKPSSSEAVQNNPSQGNTKQIRSNSPTNPIAAPAPTPKPTPTPKAPTPATNPAPVANKNKYKDGTYTATGSYNSPGGTEDLGVTLTLKNDIVTNSSLSLMAYDGRSQRYQQMFQSGYQSQVIGRSIDSINLGRVSGSSLTPYGFNDAVTQIKAQAKA
jgi:uncharacterized protein with FMN-binding domain